MKSPYGQILLLSSFLELSVKWPGPFGICAKYLSSAMCEIALGRKRLLRWIVCCLYCLDMQCLQRWDISDLPHCSKGFGMLERKSSTQLLTAARSWLNYLHSTHHLSLGFLPPISNSNSSNSLLPQWTSSQKIPARGTIWCFCVFVTLFTQSPFLLSLCSEGLWSVSLSRISSPLRSLLCCSWNPLQYAGKAVICPRFSSARLQAKDWGECWPAPAMGKGAQRAFYSLLSATGYPARAKRGSMGRDNLLKLRLCSLVHHSYASKLRWHLQLQPDTSLNLWIMSLLMHCLRQLTQQDTTDLDRN